jgi:hypothetical protein
VQPRRKLSSTLGSSTVLRQAKAGGNCRNISRYEYERRAGSLQRCFSPAANQLPCCCCAAPFRASPGALRPRSAGALVLVPAGTPPPSRPDRWAGGLGGAFRRQLRMGSHAAGTAAAAPVVVLRRMSPLAELPVRVLRLVWVWRTARARAPRLRRPGQCQLELSYTIRAGQWCNGVRASRSARFLLDAFDFRARAPPRLAPEQGVGGIEFTPRLPRRGPNPRRWGPPPADERSSGAPGPRLGSLRNPELETSTLHAV